MSKTASAGMTHFNSLINMSKIEPLSLSPVKKDTGFLKNKNKSKTVALSVILPNASDFCGAVITEGGLEVCLNLRKGRQESKQILGLSSLPRRKGTLTSEGQCQLFS